jgi:hypothetical protein
MGHRFKIGSNATEMLESVLQGKEIPEECKEALISFVEEREKLAYDEILGREAIIQSKNNWIIIITILFLLALAGVCCLLA